MLAPAAASMQSRIAMYNDNALKIGLFGANCSSGRSATTVPERWSASWEDCLALAKLGDEAGLDFMLPIARWKGYGGETDFHGASLETITWAVGLLCATKKMTVFGTVHAPLFHPLIAAKEFVTADHIGQGRVGVNIVVRLERRRVRHVRRQAARARYALRLCAGMGRRGQSRPGRAKTRSISTANFCISKPRAPGQSRSAARGR